MVLEEVVIAFVILAAGLVAAFRDLIGAIALFAAFSLGIAIAYLLLAAPDVALTEAAVGAGVMSLLFLIALMKTRDEPIDPNRAVSRPFQSLDRWAGLVVLTLMLPLAYSILAFPSVGSPTAPAVSDTDLMGEPTPYAYYVGEVGPVVDIPNVVAAVLTVYRNLDTLGEVMVAFSAVVGLMIVLRQTRLTTARDLKSDTTATTDTSPIGPPPAPYVMGPVVTTAIRTVVPLVFGFGAYLIIFGTHLTGGGFQGGVVIGAAFILLFLAFGIGSTSAWLDEGWLLRALAGGVVGFIAIGLGTIAFQGAVLEISVYPLPLIVTAEVIEIAIGLLVGGMITAIVIGIGLGLRKRTTATEEKP